MFVIVSRYLLRRGFRGITLWPFIVLRDRKMKSDAVLMNHERIHLRQQLELLVLPFYVWYVLEYLVRLIHLKNARKAYRNISFEREAYTNDTNLTYLRTRKFWAFREYL